MTLNINKRILLVFLGIFFNFLLFFTSIFAYLSNTIEIPNISADIIYTIVTAVGFLNIMSLFIGIFLLSLLAYFFGKILDSGATKGQFLLIISTTILNCSLINIPFAIVNFFGSNDSIYLPNDNLLFVFINPFLLIGCFVLKRLLKQTMLSKRVIYGYVVCFYLFQITGALFSRYILGLY